jgi:hypothetical protein
MLKQFQQKLIALLQLVLVILFIVFEELIWEQIAYPIYRYVHSLRILQKVERGLGRVNRYVILVIFIALLGSVEFLGMYAGVLFISGHILSGLGLYAAKIPIAAFTFWMFRVTEEKLMRFGWFKWIYGKIMAAIVWIKSLDIYKRTMAQVHATKIRIKAWVKEFKVRYFSGESVFMRQLKRLYRGIKRMLKR